MSYSEIQQQREYIDQIREEESSKEQFRDRNGIEQYLEIGLLINERFYKTQLRIYEDSTVEKLVIGNDISELNFDQGVKDETQQYIRPILNYKNKFTRCHFHLSQAQTIAIVVEYKLVNYEQIFQKLCNNNQLYSSQLEEMYMWKFLGNLGKIQIMTLAKQHQQVILNNNLLIVPGDQTELPVDQFNLKYRASQNIEYNLQFQISQELDIDQMLIHISFIHVEVKINNSFYSLKLLKQKDDIEQIRIGYDFLVYEKIQQRKTCKYKVQGGDLQALEIKIIEACQLKISFLITLLNTAKMINFKKQKIINLQLRRVYKLMTLKYISNELFYTIQNIIQFESRVFLCNIL
ncbi:hypothetical protein pb186bvf_017809 [Paramecium bursaria]